MFRAVLSLTRKAAPMRGRKTCFGVSNGFLLLLSVNTQAPLNFGCERATRSAGITGGVFCMAALGLERSRYREYVSKSSYGADSHSQRSPIFRVSRRLIFQSSWI